MTKEQFIVKYTQGWVGDQASLKSLLATLAGMIFNALNPLVTILTDNYTLTEEDSGGVFMIGTDAKTITLPNTKARVIVPEIPSVAAGEMVTMLLPAAPELTIL